MPSTLYCVPTEFRDTYVGKTVSSSKVKSEYVMIFNSTTKITIEIVNSRFSGKKSIFMNGQPIHDFSKVSVSDLRWTWNHPIESHSVEFTISPNTTNTGFDLKINGKDYFEYVYEVEKDEVANEVTRKEKGLSKNNSSLIFTVPPQPTSAQLCPSEPSRTVENLSPISSNSQRQSSAPRSPQFHKPSIKSPAKPAGPSNIIDAGRRLASSNKYAEFEDEDSFN